MTEYMPLSESSLLAQERHAETLIRLDLERRARQVAVPTDPEQVKLKLRELGKPICLFGEDAAARRDRLRLIVAQLGGDQEAEGKEAPTRREQKEEAELFYTPGTDELKSARIAIGEFSFSRASGRMKRERDEYESGNAHEVDSRAAFVYASVQRLAVSGSQIGDDRPLSCCRYCPVTSDIATAGWSGNVKIWDAVSTKQTKVLRGHSDRVGTLAYRSSTVTNSGPDLVTGATDGTIHLWNTRSVDEDVDTSGEQVRVIKPSAKLSGHIARVGGVGFHPSGSFVGSAGYDKTWRLWDVGTQQELLLQEGHAKEVHSIAFQCDGSLAATGDLGGIGRLWDLRSGKCILLMKGHVKQLITLDFSPNGYNLATGSDDNTTNVWDLRQRRIVYTLLAHSALVSQVKFAPGSGEYLATGSFDGSVRFWSARDWSPISCLQAHESKLTGFDLSQDDTKLLTCGYDKTFKVFQAEAFA